ncbi:MAG: hypothetical protein LBQ57_01025, partial [Spirochaetales bacterium]|nr:hypothetical protein [Spirochaetales bacterium]
GRPQGGYPGLEVEREFAALTGRPLGGYAGNGVLVTAALLNDRGETIATAQTAFSPIPEIMEGSRVWAASSIYPVTFIVKIDDISDTMTVKVVQINGKDPAAAGNAGYMQITAAGDDYKIGDKGPAGGIVFSRIGPAGKRYLEAAPADIPPAGWEEAMNLCARYKLNGYADWFMPDKSQLTMLYKMHLKGLGGFKDAVYWSSERADHPALRWYQNFYPGNQYGAPGSRQDIERRQDYRDSGGSYRYLTRPIRAF